MPWGKFDDDYANHPVMRRLSVQARWLHVAATLYCCKWSTDGLIPLVDLEECVPRRDWHMDYVRELVAAGRLHDEKSKCTSDACLGSEGLPVSDDALVVHDFLEWQIGKEQWGEMRENKVYAAHVKWHLKKPSEKCVHCMNGCRPDARCIAGACARAMPT